MIGKIDVIDDSNLANFGESDRPRSSQLSKTCQEYVNLDNLIIIENIATSPTCSND